MKRIGYIFSFTIDTNACCQRQVGNNQGKAVKPV